MIEGKVYQVPMDTEIYMRKVIALQELAESYIKQGEKGIVLAKECFIEIINNKLLFWDKIHELYPELKGKALCFNIHGHSIEEQK